MAVLFALCIAASGGALAKKKGGGGGGGTVDPDLYDKDCVTACQGKQKDCTLDCARVSSDEENKQCSADCSKANVTCTKKCPPRKKDRY